MNPFNSSSIDFSIMTEDEFDERVKRYRIVKQSLLLLEDIYESFKGDPLDRLHKTREYLDMCLSMIRPGLDNFLSPQLKKFSESYEAVSYARWVILPTIYKQEIENTLEDGPEIITNWN